MISDSQMTDVYSYFWLRTDTYNQQPPHSTVVHSLYVLDNNTLPGTAENKTGLRENVGQLDQIAHMYYSRRTSK